MNIIVCIKQVPDTAEEKINPETGTLIREGVPSIVNPFDEFAVEEALCLRAKFGGKVTVITMGPPQAVSALRQAVAMGADGAVLLSDRASVARNPCEGAAGAEFRCGYFFFLGVDVRAVLHEIFLDGNTFQDSHSVEKKPFVADLSAGPGFSRRRGTAASARRGRPGGSRASRDG